MNLTPHIKTEGTSKFQIGEIINNTVHYDFEKIKTYLNIKGHLLFGKNFRIHKEDEELIFKLYCYFILGLKVYHPNGWFTIQNTSQSGVIIICSLKLEK